MHRTLTPAQALEASRPALNRSIDRAACAEFVQKLIAWWETPTAERAEPPTEPGNILTFLAEVRTSYTEVPEELAGIEAIFRFGVVDFAPAG